MIVAVTGLCSLFVESFPGPIMMIIDSIGGILLAAGGIAFNIAMKGVSCDENHGQAMLDNSLLNEGCIPSSDGRPYCGVYDAGPGDAPGYELLANCKKAFANEIFQFLFLGLAVILIALTWVIHRSSRGGGTRATYV
jgi:hypothetical protein